MSKIVLVCCKDRQSNLLLPKHLEVLFERMRPDNLQPAAPLVLRDDGLMLGVFNPVKCLAVKNTSGFPIKWAL